MVIFISGPSYSGKTLLSQILLEKYKIPYLSVDHLKMGLFRADKNCGFTPLDDFNDLGRKIWPIIKGIAMTNIENSQDLIIEGCYLLPELLGNFDERYLKEMIQVFIVFSEKYIKNNFQSKILKHRSAIENRNYENEATIADLVDEHVSLKNRCIDNNMHYCEIRENWQKDIRMAYCYIDDQIKRIRKRKWSVRSKSR